MQTWTNSRGETVTVGAEVREAMDLTGHRRAGTAAVVVVATRNGVREMVTCITADVPEAARAAGVVARVGSVALTADRLATLRAEVAAVAATPAVVEYRRRYAEGMRAAEDAAMAARLMAND